MDNKFVKWFLILVVVAIWLNMIRVSIPTIVDYFRQNNEVRQDHLYSSLSQNNFKGRNFSFDPDKVRNPFLETVEKHSLYSETRKVDDVKPKVKEVMSYFDLKGIFVVDGERKAILEGKIEFGVSGIYYVKEGDMVLGEKVVEIGDNYVIILKEGKKIVLYGVR